MLWERGLGGLTPTQLRHGIHVCATAGEDWPPSLPAFRAMCLGIPTLAAVRAALSTVAPESIEPFVALVWRHLDGHRLRHATADKSDRMIADAYELSRDAVLRGEPLPQRPAGRIEAPIAPLRTPASEATIETAVSTLATALGSRYDDRSQPLPGMQP